MRDGDESIKATTIHSLTHATTTGQRCERQDLESFAKLAQEHRVSDQIGEVEIEIESVTLTKKKKKTVSS